MQSSKATKSRLSSQKWVVISLLLSGVSLAISSTLRIREEKRCEEIRAKYAVRYAARQVAMNALDHDIKATEKEMDRITKIRKWTAADKERFDAIIKEHQARLAELQQL